MKLEYGTENNSFIKNLDPTPPPKKNTEIRWSRNFYFYTQVTNSFSREKKRRGKKMQDYLEVESSSTRTTKTEF